MKYYENDEKVKNAEKVGYFQFDYAGEYGECKDDFVSFEFNGVNIINPFIDDSGRFDLSLESAYALYGEKNVNYFIEKTWVR